MIFLFPRNIERILTSHCIYKLFISSEIVKGNEDLNRTFIVILFADITFGLIVLQTITKIVKVDNKRNNEKLNNEYILKAINNTADSNLSNLDKIRNFDADVTSFTTTKCTNKVVKQASHQISTITMKEISLTYNNG